MEEFNTKSKSLDNIQSNPESIDSILETIDIDSVHECLKEEFKIPLHQELNIVKKDNIKSVPTEEYGLYRIDSHSIDVSSKIFTSTFSKNESGAKLLSLEIVCHEQVHAVSPRNKSVEEEINSGFSSCLLGKDNKRILYSNFDLFNEGVVEKIARDVFVNYLNKNREYATEKGKNKFMSLWNSSSLAKDRPREQEFRLVELLVERLARESGFEKEFVWNAIKQAYINGDEIFDEDLKLELRKILPEDFIPKLATYIPPDIFRKESDYGYLVKVLKEDKSKNFLKKIINKINSLI
ncbi:MAG: hypothetical protein KBC44_02915 [Candidatus Pacebacteria bacterium]|nr:hypothetical protein [Candidatus Paceibacterota bacterium]MBP9839906.1 hypothetical protein [Candidatus Paceibacterota bacterium]